MNQPQAHSFTPMTPAATTSEADRREREALDEAFDQLAHGWLPSEVVVVLADAHAVIADLRDGEAAK